MHLAVEFATTDKIMPSRQLATFFAFLLAVKLGCAEEMKTRVESQTALADRDLENGNAKYLRRLQGGRVSFSCSRLVGFESL